MDNSVLSTDPEANNPTSNSKSRGNWVTFPFITGTMIGLTLAGVGYLSNIIVYLIQEFHFQSISAAQLSNIIIGGNNVFPLVGAILADSFFGNFSVLTITSCVSFLGLVLLVLTALLQPLRPPPCLTESSLCKSASYFQYTVLYGSLILTSIGFGGSRYTLATMGANQFNKSEDQTTFFNSFFFTLYSSSVIAATAIVFIQEDVSWAVGFGVCVAANFIGLVIFLVGKQFYKRGDKPEGSPFTGLARVVVATVKKRHVELSSRCEDYYCEKDEKVLDIAGSLTKSFRFLNRAAIKTEGDIKPDGSIAKPWRICSVQQVEDFKTLITIFPIWSSNILVAIPIAVQLSLTVLQALAMDRHLGKHFQIPAGSISVLVLITNSITVPLIDRIFNPCWRLITRKYPTPFQIVGVGHGMNVISMVISALVESQRLKLTDGQMSVTWLFPQLILVGIGEAFHFPGQVSLYYKEFPVSFRSTGTAIISFIIGVSFYLSTGLIAVVEKVTNWLPDNINEGRVDNVYWVMVGLGVINFVYYLICAHLYTYQNVEVEQ
ncbi:protein NRT1/ PTR FAMILY 2.7-like [Mercurialis annua]|uniref:protein NRT1/ PTR FAMILY 2.7-like n=1 Tax=Mercurialis annua TaxID=3986 RepID=UPI002160B596|nr:protein NRT1/ PTR FAMILY 2.7-like [Mercurialis annua]